MNRQFLQNDLTVPIIRWNSHALIITYWFIFDYKTLKKKHFYHKQLKSPLHFLSNLNEQSFPTKRTNSLPSKIPARTRKKVCFCYPRPVSPIRRLTENCQPCRSHKVYFRHYSVAVSVSLKTIQRPHLGSAIWDAEWRRHHLNRFYVHLRLLETIKCIQIPFRIRWGGPLLVCDQYCYKIPSV